MVFAQKGKVFVNSALRGSHRSCAILSFLGGSVYFHYKYLLSIVCWMDWQELENFSTQDFELRVKTKLYTNKQLNWELTGMRTYQAYHPHGKTFIELRPLFYMWKESLFGDGRIKYAGLFAQTCMIMPFCMLILL